MASVIHLGAWVITLSVVCAAGQQLSDEVRLLLHASPTKTFKSLIYFRAHPFLIHFTTPIG